ncbi:Uncharacterised protein [Klebsiella variicola]|nr:Uncharacterised protein [Klebsiella variicola]
MMCIFNFKFYILSKAQIESMFLNMIFISAVIFSTYFRYILGGIGGNCFKLPL